MKINGRDVTLTSEELDLLKRLKDNGVISIAKSDEDVFIWHDGDFSTQGSMINVRWFKGFDWMQKGETLVVGKLIYESGKPKTVWDLKKGDIFWYVTLFGEVKSEMWNELTIYRDMRSQGNVFLTEEEAEFESKRREVVTRVRKYARPFALKEQSWFPFFDHLDNKICADFDVYIQSSRYYFASKKDIEDAVAEVGEDDFKKYYLGVVEDESRKTCKD